MHSLPKNYKSEDDFKNNPVEDSKITLKLFIKLEEILSLDKDTQAIFYFTFKRSLFQSFFKYIDDKVVLVSLNHTQLKSAIRSSSKCHH